MIYNRKETHLTVLPEKEWISANTMQEETRLFGTLPFLLYTVRQVALFVFRISLFHSDIGCRNMCGSDTPKNTGETLYLGSTSSESFKRERWVKLRCTDVIFLHTEARDTIFLILKHNYNSCLTRTIIIEGLYLSPLIIIFDACHTLFTGST